MNFHPCPVLPGIRNRRPRVTVRWDCHFKRSLECRDGEGPFCIQKQTDVEFETEKQVMTDLDIRFLSFRDPLIRSVLEQTPHDSTIFVFPSENSKNAAIQEFQAVWQFTDTRFYSMEEFKRQLFVSPRPLLREEKRSLAFYYSLDKKDREVFKLTTYFQSIELAHHFFELWEEFNEELVDEDIDPARFELNDVEWLEWQSQLYSRLRSIKKRYREWIHQRGVEDDIFIYKPDCLDDRLVQSFHRLVFVNQFYYTRLEKEILNHLVGINKKVIVYYQIAEQLVDTRTLQIHPFTLQELGWGRNRSIRISEHPNPFSLHLSVLRTLSQEEVTQLVDVTFHSDPQTRFLSPAQFKLSPAYRCGETSIYHFFNHLHTLIKSLLWEPERHKWLLPMDVFRDVLSDDAFLAPFSRSQAQNEARALLRSLIRNEIQYLDLDGEVFQLDMFSAHPGRITLLHLLNLLSAVCQIGSIHDLVEILDRHTGPAIRIQEIITEKERRYTDILDVFYRMLADFYSLESLGWIHDWDLLVGSVAPAEREVRVAEGILRLFLDYMKPKIIHPVYKDEISPRYRISSLLDTRNIGYPSVAISNVNEGVIPHHRQVPFLFTEKQRQLLHLKTYDDIKLREKYYFFRLVLNTPRVHVFTLRQVETDIEPSSFLEELLWYTRRDRLVYTVGSDERYDPVYHSFLPQDSDYPLSRDVSDPARFFSIPLQKETDFPDAAIRLSYYGLSQLLKNPFLYYLKTILRLEPLRSVDHEDFTRSLLGNLAHDIFNECWKRLLEHTSYPIQPVDFGAVPDRVIDDAIVYVMEWRPDYYYKIPHNHTLIYFKKITLAALRFSIRNLFRYLHDTGLSQKSLNIIPERERLSRAERVYKTLMPRHRTPLDLDVQIRGRADLRIEDDETDKRFIFDYKTGSSDTTQLLFYELFYYLLDSFDLADRVKSYFIQLLDWEITLLASGSRKGPETAKRELLRALELKIERALIGLLEDGFGLPPQKSYQNQDWEITRADLFAARRHRIDSPATGGLIRKQTE